MVMAEGLRPASVRQAGPIPHAVIDIVGLIDLSTRGGELMEDIDDLRGGIIPELRYKVIVGEGCILRGVSWRTREADSGQETGF